MEAFINALTYYEDEYEDILTDEEIAYYNSEEDD